jgi:xanthine dehydrogenase YagR molybdenum-binding subunit
MASYIGTATSRVDGRAKVTGEARYAGEFNVSGLVHGYVVESTIPRGRVARIDAGDALGVSGVIDVLTHQNRPEMADDDKAYKDETAPEKGSPYRPLFDDVIRFSGQTLALVLADDWDTARVAASMVKIEYKREPHVTDLRAQRSEAFAVEKPEKPRGNAAKAFSTAAVRHEAEYFIPSEHHNPMELFASTAVWDDGHLTVHDKTQGVQNVQQYLSGVFKMKADSVSVMSPYMGGGFGSGLRPQYQVVLAVLGALALKRSVRVMLTRAQMYALGYRPATIERLALGANGDGILESMQHEAIAMTSQFEEFSRNDTGWGNLLYKTPNAKFEHKLVKLDVPTSCDMRAPARLPASSPWNARWMRSPSHSRSIRSNSACNATPIFIRVRTFPTPASSCANATARAPPRSAGTSATPSRARCGTAVNWSAGAWRQACGRPCRCRRLSASC